MSKKYEIIIVKFYGLFQLFDIAVYFEILILC